MHVFRNLSAADSSHRGKQPERMVQLLLKEHTAAGDGGDDAAESFWGFAHATNRAAAGHECREICAASYDLGGVRFDQVR